MNKLFSHLNTCIFFNVEKLNSDFYSKSKENANKHTEAIYFIFK